MPKNSKNQHSNGATAADAPSTETAAKKKRSKPAARKPSPKPAAKKAAKVGAKKTRKPARKTGGYEPSDDEIRLRAYFIAERRVQLSLGGDPSNDWLEARQQLVEEAEQRAAEAAAPAP